MTRMSRSVAQRYATKKRRRKDTPRVPSRPLQPESSAQIEESAEATPSVSPTSGLSRPQTGRTAVTRRLTDHSQQYGYVWGDIRRIVILSSGLLVGLLALSFVVR